MPEDSRSTTAQEPVVAVWWCGGDEVWLERARMATSTATVSGEGEPATRVYPRLVSRDRWTGDRDD